VRIADRPFTAAVGDMIEGVIHINRLEPPEADRVRTQLWRTMLQFTVETSPTRRQASGSSTTDSDRDRPDLDSGVSFGRVA
jgi:hypothetical protein